MVPARYRTERRLFRHFVIIDGSAPLDRETAALFDRYHVLAVVFQRIALPRLHFNHKARRFAEMSAPCHNHRARILRKWRPVDGYVRHEIFKLRGKIFIRRIRRFVQRQIDPVARSAVPHHLHARHLDVRFLHRLYGLFGFYHLARIETLRRKGHAVQKVLRPVPVDKLQDKPAALSVFCKPFQRHRHLLAARRRAETLHRALIPERLHAQRIYIEKRCAVVQKCKVRALCARRSEIDGRIELILRKLLHRERTVRLRRIFRQREPPFGMLRRHVSDRNRQRTESAQRVRLPLRHRKDLAVRIVFLPRFPNKLFGKGLFRARRRSPRREMRFRLFYNVTARSVVQRNAAPRLYRDRIGTVLPENTSR